MRIKSHSDILATITGGGMNRGLLFDKEMVPFCGKTFRVKARITIFVDEKTGKLKMNEDTCRHAGRSVVSIKI